MGMDHAEASDEMEISRSTFTRLIEQARKKTAQFLVEGKELFIEGGNVHFRGNIIRCQDCGHMFNIKINALVSKCPECESGNLINLAGGFGHGRCCVRHHNRGD
jgi:predicted Zn-ribbon and HTH transcriptional regulator